MYSLRKQGGAAGIEIVAKSFEENIRNVTGVANTVKGERRRTRRGEGLWIIATSQAVDDTPKKSGEESCPIRLFLGFLFYWVTMSELRDAMSLVGNLWVFVGS